MRFRANGFEATSVDKVGARAEVSKRTFYNHFPSKDELFAEILRVAIAAAIHSPERAKELISRLGRKEGGLLAWIRVAQKDGRLKPGGAALAVQQLEHLVKGVAFWPQVAMGQPKLSPREQNTLAAKTVALFLSHHAA